MQGKNCYSWSPPGDHCNVKNSPKTVGFEFPNHTLDMKCHASLTVRVLRESLLGSSFLSGNGEKNHSRFPTDRNRNRHTYRPIATSHWSVVMNWLSIKAALRLEGYTTSS